MKTSEAKDDKIASQKSEKSHPQSDYEGHLNFEKANSLVNLPPSNPFVNNQNKSSNPFVNNNAIAKNPFVNSPIQAKFSETDQDILAIELSEQNQSLANAPAIQRSAENPNEEARQRFRAGSAAYTAGNYAEALRLFLESYRVASSEARGVMAYNVAICYQRLGHFAEAIQFYQESLSFPGLPPSEQAHRLEQIRLCRAGQSIPTRDVPTPATPEATAAATTNSREIFNQARTAYTGGNFAQALALFSQIYQNRDLSRDERQAMAFNMATCHQRLGQFESAISLFLEYLEFGVSNADDVANAHAHIRQCRRGIRQSTPANEAPSLSTEQQRTMFREALGLFGAGNYATALGLFQQVYASPTTPEDIRAPIVYNMGLAYQRLQQMDRAIETWLEYLTYPSVRGDERTQVLERIRQARAGEVSDNIRMTISSGGASSGGSRVVLTGIVYMNTSSADPDPRGTATIGRLVSLLLEQRSAHPTATFRISVSGGASRRWQSPRGETPEALNQQLSQQRAERVLALLQTNFSSADLSSGVFSFDTQATGAILPELFGEASDDNGWQYRSVFISVLLNQATGATGTAAGITITADGNILGITQANRARTRLAALEPADRSVFISLTRQAASDTERLYLYKALASAHSIREIETFANRIRGQNAQWLNDNLRLTGSSSGTGVQQQWSHSCNATMVQAVQGEMDPIYSLRIHDENPNFATVDNTNGMAQNPNLATEQRNMLTSTYNGGLAGAAGHSGIAVGRGVGGGRGRWADDLLNQRSGATGMNFTTRRVGVDITLMNLIATMNNALRRGMPVPIVIGNGLFQFTHYVLVTSITPATAATPITYTIHDPGSGQTVTRTISQLMNGTLALSGSNRITAIEMPGATP
jgi:tetratricopeptide (TPR) repeat protein